ncbi:MAG: ABC transporter substrate-binding protein [Beijerinckiaceae bacterium]|nr:ABC transporter substrate-binding protein [Beijerinckiaceae bacterium]
MINASRRTFMCSLALAAMVRPARASSAGVLRFGVTVADNVVYAPVFAAQELGYFEAAGLKLAIVPLRGSAIAEEALEAAHVDVIDHVIPYTGRTIVNGAEARVIATASTGFLGWSLIVRADSPAQNVRDLVGKKLGVGLRLSVGEMAAQRLSDQVSGRFELVHNGPGALVPALRSGEIDAMLFSASVAQREVAAGNARTILELTDPADRTAIYGYAASAEAREKRPEDLRRFLAAVLRATAFMKNDRQWSMRFLKTFVRVNDDSFAATLQDQIIANLSPTGETKADDVERAMALAARAWNAPALIEAPVERVFTNEFLPDDGA